MGMNTSGQMPPGVETARLPDGALWCLALSAMYTMVNGTSGCTLAPSGLSSEEKAPSVRMLAQHWGVTGPQAQDRRTQAADAIEWLIDEGHRADPDLGPMDDPAATRDLLAWDIARAAMVTRHAFHAGYLTEEAAWRYLRRSALLAQAHYDSWADFGSHYVRGMRRWAAKLTDAESASSQTDEVAAAVARVAREPASPWQTLDWRTPIDEKTVHGVPGAAAPLPKESLAVLSFLDRMEAMRCTPRCLAAIMVVVLALAGLIWQVAKKDTSASRHLTPVQAFAELRVTFGADGTVAYFDAPIRHPVSEFRYSIDSDIPNRQLQQQALGADGYPMLLRLPAAARYLTVRARLDDGTLSPVRRFDVR